MTKCLFCLGKKLALTREHIIPEALGGNLFLANATCKDCQERCNKSFEHRFLKGTNFVALIRSFLGIKGKRNEPVYGFDQHGEPLAVLVQAGFPPIRIGLEHGSISRPMQIILTTQEIRPLSYHFLPNEIRRPISAQFFDEIVYEIPEGAKIAAFWADGDLLPINYWRELLEAFIAWSRTNDMTAMASTAAAGNAQFELRLDWNTEYRNRGLAKICFMYAMQQMEPINRYNPALDHTRKYILDGMSYPSGFWSHAPILQWNGLFPGAEEFKNHKFTYFLATINSNDCLYGLVKLHNMGLFAVNLARSVGKELCDNTITTYLLEKENETYILREEKWSTEEVKLFTEIAKSTGQL